MSNREDKEKNLIPENEQKVSTQIKLILSIDNIRILIYCTYGYLYYYHEQTQSPDWEYITT